MQTLLESIKKSADYIKSKANINPEIAVVLGSGLGGFADNIGNPVIIPYSDIPGFLKSTAPGHKGRIVLGELAGKKILCMQGRFHYYEGYSMKDITFPIRVMKELGIKKLILTNSAGGLNPDFTPGDLMIINDHINFMGQNPLIGGNESELGARFPDMTYAYNLEMRNKMKSAAKEIGISIQEGVYIGYSGPSFETPAEIKLFQSFGGSAVGMSTVPEVIVASHSKIDTCAVSCITNLAAGILDQPLTEEEVMEVSGAAGKKFLALLMEVMKQL